MRILLLIILALIICSCNTFEESEKISSITARDSVELRIIKISLTSHQKIIIIDNIIKATVCVHNYAGESWISGLYFPETHRKKEIARILLDKCDGYYDGREIFAYDEGYDHPLGYFFHHLIYDENSLWSFDDEVADMISKKYNTDDIEEFNKDNNLFKFDLCG